jgi:hypothetical protein
MTMNYDWCFQEGIDDSEQALLLKALEPLVTSGKCRSTIPAD